MTGVTGVGVSTFRQIVTRKIGAEFTNDTITSTPHPTQGTSKGRPGKGAMPQGWAEMLGATAAAVFMEVR